MNFNDPRYQNQALHTTLALFTVVNGKFKVLLLKRKNEPHKGKWILISGSAYNDEFAEDAMRREIFEKTKLENIDFEMFDVFTDPNRVKEMRMICIAYIGVADSSIINKFKETEKAEYLEWFEIDKIPELGYDHNEILKKAIKTLKSKIFQSTIMKKLYPNNFTLPELITTYESILNIKLDKRNFRKKMISDNIIEETGLFQKNIKTKPSKLYRFCNTPSIDFRYKKW